MMNLKVVVVKLLLWGLAAWVSVALLQFNPYIGLGVALVGGVLFGLVLFK